MQKIDLLLNLAEKCQLFSKIEITTTSLSKEFSVSQQTISNVLRELEKENLIYRKPSYSGIRISFKELGIKNLENYKDKLNKLITNEKQIKGEIFEGIGEGKFYTQLPNYKKQFIKKLNINPYPGTLNIKCSKEEINKFLFGKKPITIEGFKTKKRTFGIIKCYLIKIHGISGSIIIPNRTSHKENIIEIISKKNLREKLKLKNNNTVKIKWP
jgi:riboflavin kinase, archaea type